MGFSVFWRICAGVTDFVWPLLGVSVLRGGGRDGQPYGYEDLLGPNFFKDPPYITVIYPRKSRRPEHPLPAPGFTPFPLGSAPRSRRCDIAATGKTRSQLVDMVLIGSCLTIHPAEPPPLVPVAIPPLVIFQDWGPLGLRITVSWVWFGYFLVFLGIGF